MKLFKSISPLVIGRLPKYLRFLRSLEKKGFDRTSSAAMANAMGSTASQIRQDLSSFGTYGSQGYGYNVSALAMEIEKILGIHERHEIAVVGVGGIGKALLEHMDFTCYNYHVTAAFDVNPELIGSSINGVYVYGMDCFAEMMRKAPVDICMLTVPKASAKEVASKLSQFGVPAIWNFTGEDLDLEQTDVIVQNVNFYDSLFALTYYLEDGREKQKTKRAVNS